MQNVVIHIHTENESFSVQRLFRIEPTTYYSLEEVTMILPVIFWSDEHSSTHVGSFIVTEQSQFSFKLWEQSHHFKST